LDPLEPVVPAEDQVEIVVLAERDGDPVSASDKVLGDLQLSEVSLGL